MPPQKLYFGNNTAKTNILLDNVTVNYDVTTREYYTYTLNNNRAAINFNNTSFVNAPNNQGILENATECHMVYILTVRITKESFILQHVHLTAHFARCCRAPADK